MDKTKKERLLEELKRKRNSSALSDAETVLRAWQFMEGRSKGHARVWSYRHITLTLHVPHGRGGRVMDPGAVAMVIRKVGEAALLQEKEEEEKDDAD